MPIWRWRRLSSWLRRRWDRQSYISAFILWDVARMGPGVIGVLGRTHAHWYIRTHAQTYHVDEHATVKTRTHTREAGWVTGEWIRVLVVIWKVTRLYESGVAMQRSMGCGHAMRHGELETTVRAPAINVKGCHFSFFFLFFVFLGLGIKVTIFGIVVSFCQFLTTVLTKNGDFLCEKKKNNQIKRTLPWRKGKK